MRRRNTYESEMIRLYAILAFMIVSLGFLMLALWRIQVSRGAEFQGDLMRQSVRRVRTPGTRGRILDRHGACLADNRPSYCVAIYLEELRQLGRNRTKVKLVGAVQQLVARLADVLELKIELSKEDIERHIARRSPLPLLAWRDVGERPIARLVERTEGFRGVDVYVEPVRVYPNGTTAAHVLGYVGRTGGESGVDEGPYHYYLPDMAGRRGIEATQDRVLRGRAGGRCLVVDVAGFTYTNIVRTGSSILAPLAPEPGNDAQLTIDLRIQQCAERAINGTNGAVVVVDPNNGDVLALASFPTFDPNAFARGLSVAEFDRLRLNPSAPLRNKATSAAYPPGSTFKVVVAAAALGSGKVSRSTVAQCLGYYPLGRTVLHCWNWKYGGHGLLNLRQSLEQSCNTYFCTIGNTCGYRHIFRMATSMGMGEVTGIEIDSEAAGNVPSVARIRTKGDVANVSVGQGALLVTPLQMAMVTATIANGGKLYRPRLVRGTRAFADGSFVPVAQRDAREMKWARESIKVIRLGMKDVVQAPRGTGKRARIEGVEMAGKTGTAEYGPKEEGKKRAWMIAFAPFEKPRYAVAMVVEDALSGGRTVAPRVKQMMAEILLKGRDASDGD